jgi:hypothetical protein
MNTNSLSSSIIGKKRSLEEGERKEENVVMKKGKSLLEKQAITLTFGDRAENHRGMQIIGEGAVSGFSLRDLERTKEYFEREKGVEGCRIVKLHEIAEMVKKDEVISLPEAYLLIVPRGGCHLVDYNKLCEEMLSVEWDEKAFMYGRVVNKKARHNLCFDESSQRPDYENGLGTIVSFNEVPELGKLKRDLVSIVPNAGELKVEGNYYYDVNKCGIGYHGDSERKKVIGMRLGEMYPLCYQWFEWGKPISKRVQFSLGQGDLYMMSEKAVGSDWKTKRVPTLRHAAGCADFIVYKEKKEKGSK